MKNKFTPAVLCISLIIAAVAVALFAYAAAAPSALKAIYQDTQNDSAMGVQSAPPISPTPEESEGEGLDTAPTTEALLEAPATTEADTAEESTKKNDNVPLADAPIEPPETAPMNAPMKIAIIIDDMGPDRHHGFEIIEIDAPLTLAFLPYAKGLPEMTDIAQEGGHELMIHMPMEPMNSKLDMGDIALHNDADRDVWAGELDKAFASFDGYVGLNNHMGSRLTQNEDAMDYVMERLSELDLYFIDSKTISTSVAGDVAKNSGIASASRDVFLDHEETIEFVRGALETLERTALRKGHAIAIGHPKAVTIQGLQEWIPTLEAKGIEIVHASTLVHVHEAAAPEGIVEEAKPEPELELDARIPDDLAPIEGVVIEENPTIPPTDFVPPHASTLVNPE